MPRHFTELLESGNALNGVLVVPRRLPIGRAIDELETILVCSKSEEWRNMINILPF